MLIWKNNCWFEKKNVDLKKKNVDLKKAMSIWKNKCRFEKINVSLKKMIVDLKKIMLIWKNKCRFDQINFDRSFLASIAYIYLWQIFRLNHIGFVTVSCVNVVFLFEATLSQFRKKPVKTFNALTEFISINVVNFQFSNITKNAQLAWHFQSALSWMLVL